MARAHIDLELSPAQQRLLEAVQQAVPLARRPYELLALAVGLSEAQVIADLAEWTQRGLIRELTGVFDAASLGYACTLVAGEVPRERLDAAGVVVAEHPGVSHCYARAGALTLWYTLAVAPDSTLGLEGTLSRLTELTGAARMLSLPTLRRYKLDVRFNLSGEMEAAGAIRAPQSPPAGAAAPPSPEQIRAIRALQTPLPPVAEPFDVLAPAAGMTADQLLAHARDFLADGRLRRYAAVLRHRAAGATTNVLVAWQVDASSADAFGTHAARLLDVSHCYLRPSADGWPYNLYTMIHGQSTHDVQRTIAGIIAAAGAAPHTQLTTLREYKKARVQLFSDAFAAWERRDRTGEQENSL